MPRDMMGTGRYPPHPRHPPFSFYSSVRLGDPELLEKILQTDPYFVTQDNGAGAPLHFAVTYCQLDMVHHLLNLGAEINQRDKQGFTPLHRAAYLAHLPGYLELYEYLLSKGADPSILTEDYERYLNPGCKLPIEVCSDDEYLRRMLIDLEEKYAYVPKAGEPNPDIGCWWTLYDYGLEAVKEWPRDYQHDYPEEVKRRADRERHKQFKRLKRQCKAKAYKLLQAGVDPRDINMPELMASLQNEGLAGGAIDALQQQPQEDVDPSVAFLFPGQGSQAVGMLQASASLPAVQDMISKANHILGYDILQLCTQGPKEELDNTEKSQPALFIAGLAAVEKLRAVSANLVGRCSAAAGLSLGEYTALVFAGAMSFEDGLKVVKARAESMAAAAREGEAHGMLSVVGLPDQDLTELCELARQQTSKDHICQIANYLFPQGRVVSGHTRALEIVRREAVARGALKAQMLAVGGAFHTSLMAPAGQKLRQVLDTIDIKLPRIPVYSNVTAQPFQSAAEIKELLCLQLVEAVQWEETLKALMQQGKSKMFELGPGQQIRAMLKRLDMECWKNVQVVNP